MTFSLYIKSILNLNTFQCNSLDVPFQLNAPSTHQILLKITQDQELLNKNALKSSHYRTLKHI